MDELPQKPPFVSDVRQFHTIGPWPSKSGGGLSVPIMLTHPEAQHFFDYDAVELDRIGVDIRGVRVFFVHRVRDGGVAGNQFHRIRTEIAFVIDGSVRWEFEDLHGGIRELQASPECVVYIPPFILHRATFQGAGGTLATLANTIYVRDEPRTHDTYSAERFRSMQASLRMHESVR